MRGEPVQGKRYPVCPEDDGICQKFRKWCLDNDIDCVRPIMSGPGMEDSLWYVEDQEKILKWLEENGVIINPKPEEKLEEE